MVVTLKEGAGTTSYGCYVDITFVDMQNRDANSGRSTFAKILWML